MTSRRETIPGLFARVTSPPTIALYILTLSLGLVVVWSTPLNKQMASLSSIQHLEFFFIVFRVPLTLDLLTPTMLAFCLYFACFILAFRGKGNYNRSLFSKTAPSGPSLPNWLLVMPLLSASLLVVVVLVSRLQEILGIPTGGLPNASVPMLFAELVTSPISEELNFRITTIGLLVGVRTLVAGGARDFARGKRAELFCLSFLEPDSAKGKVGLGQVANHGVRGIHWAEWLLLFVSSVGFGVAHLSSQSNWDVGKISTAALSGFIIGLSYLAYGAYAAILLHWFFNYYIQFYPLISTASLMAGSPLGPTMGALDYLTYAWSTILGALGLVLAAKEISSKRAVSR